MTTTASQPFNQLNYVKTLVTTNLEACGINCTEHHVFRDMVYISLVPDSFTPKTNGDSATALDTFDTLIERLKLAGLHAAPDFGQLNTFPQTLLCAIAYMTMQPFIDKGFNALSAGHYKPVMSAAYYMTLELETLDAARSFDAEKYKTMRPDARLLTDMHAVALCEKVIGGTLDGAAQCKALRTLSAYAAVLKDSETAMATHFRGLMSQIEASSPALTVAQLEAGNPQMRNVVVFPAFRAKAP